MNDPTSWNATTPAFAAASANGHDQRTELARWLAVVSVRLLAHFKLGTLEKTKQNEMSERDRERELVKNLIVKMAAATTLLASSSEL